MSKQNDINKDNEPQKKSELKNNNVSYSHSNNFGKTLQNLNTSIAFTSYQSNILYTLGRKSDGKIHIHQSAIERPMGLCSGRTGNLFLSAGHQIIKFCNDLDTGSLANQIFDACYVARTVHNSGKIDAHDIGIDKQGRPIFVNTRYNCLATIDDRYSFRELWRPHFISALVPEDRCHLNGLAMQDGEPAYVSAVSRSDTIDGWRDRRHGGGILIDVRSNKIICEGLSMPHSPRLHNGELWVLNSGTGELGVIEGASTGKGKFVARAFCPGFTRGLAIRGNYAFVGLSRPRYERFDGLPLSNRLKETDSDPWTGIQIIDLRTGICVDWFRMDGPVMEIYDVALIDHRCAMTITPDSVEIKNYVTLTTDLLTQ